MDNIAFNSLEDLYQRLKPALRTKAREMKRAGITYVKEDDIWKYLQEIKWRNANDLSLSEMVNDILETDNKLIVEHMSIKIVKKEIKNNRDELL